MEEARLRCLIEAGRSLSAELDPDVVLDRLLEVAQELTGARYAAVGVLGEGGEGLERFLTRGISSEIHRAIGALPKDRGVLGVLTRERRPIRVADVGGHPESYGFPLAHPPMHTFLGVPILMRGEAWGKLYLTEKRDGTEFTSDDEEAASVLAGWAALGVANARLYTSARRQRDELQRANRGLATMAEVHRAVGGVTDLERVLALVVKRSRVLLGARVATLALLRDGELVVAEVAGDAAERIRGKRLPLNEPLAAEMLQTGRPRRFDRLPDRSEYGLLGARTALVAPMLLRSKPVGFIGVFDRETGDGGFSLDDERLLLAFAAGAAAAVVTAESASREALRRSIRAAERERRYWARALNDETLQSLAALKIRLSNARAAAGSSRLEAAVDEAIEIIGDEIAALRSLIVELRPASLDELGPVAAIETLVEHVRSRSELDIVLEVRLAYEEGRTPHRHLPEIEVAIFRLVQEGLRNIVEHADARSVRIRVVEAESEPEAVEVEVDDDGRGFDAGEAQDGFGLLGIREHVALVDGDVRIAARPGGGTRLYGRIPVRRRLSSGRTAGSGP